MNTNRRTINKFNRSHADLRKFLRLVSYGCYHRTLFGRHEIKPRSYDDLLRQIKFFVPEKNLQVTRHDKCAYFTFVGDFRHGTKNYFYTSFLLKTLLADHCLYKIILLQLLDEKPMTFPELLERADEILMTHKPEKAAADLAQLLRRRLNELIDSGIVRRVKVNNKVRYQKISAPLNDLSADEVKILYNALKFSRNVSLIGTAGYFLCDALKSFHDTESGREIFQFKNNNFARILDDDILLTVIEARRRRQKILVERENKLPVVVTPLAVETDFLCSRQYLVVLRGKELIRLRVEKITAVKLMNDDGKNFSSPPEKLREIKLRVRFKDESERRQREKILLDELPARIVNENSTPQENFSADQTGCNGRFKSDGTIYLATSYDSRNADQTGCNVTLPARILDKSDDEFICVVETTDPLRIYPLLWKFQPWAEILPGTDGLRERMISDTREVLKNYAEFV